MNPRGFHDLKEGDIISDAVTITEHHISTGAGIFKDFNPIHVNREFAKKTRFKLPIAHGCLTAGVMCGVLGNHLSSKAVALVQIDFRFRAPVHAGDTITTEWEVESKDFKPDKKSGVVAFSGVSKNHEHTIVVEGNCKILVSE